MRIDRHFISYQIYCAYEPHCFYFCTNVSMRFEVLWSVSARKNDFIKKFVIMGLNFFLTSVILTGFFQQNLKSYVPGQKCFEFEV